MNPKRHLALALLTSALAAFLLFWLSATAEAATSITDRLAADHSVIEVTSEPTGTAYVHVAAMKNLQAEGIVYYDVPASQTVIKPPSAERPVLDIQAFSSSHTAIGGWAGRLQTEPAKPPVEEPPVEETKEPPVSSMLVGIDSGGWLLTNDTALMAGKRLVFRSQNKPDSVLAAYEARSFKNIDLIGHNPPTNVNAETFASEALARAKAHPGNVAEELLNEPQNPYLGGSESQASIEAYARIVNTAANRFAAAKLANPPKLLWSCDGGYRGVPSWGAKVWPLLNANARALGRPTEHPYGGTSNRERSALGGRGRVEECARLTGQKSWVTEIGWPTAVGQPNTGDSLQWTWAEQAHNIESFLAWAPAYAEDVTVFQYRDYGTNAFYGTETSGGTHKPSFDVVERLAP